MKIYTKTGDGGQTGLFGGTRVSKSDARVAAYGDVDELSSTLGVVRAAGGLDASTNALVERIQSDLFRLGAELATAPGRELKGFDPIDDAAVLALEKAIDETEGRLEPLSSFVLPGGSIGAAHLHVCRTVCRRAERAVVSIDRAESDRTESDRTESDRAESDRAESEPEPEIRPVVLRYLNRLSDLLFMLARDANRAAGVPDVPWIP